VTSSGLDFSSDVLLVSRNNIPKGIHDYGYHRSIQGLVLMSSLKKGRATRMNGVVEIVILLGLKDTFAWVSLLGQSHLVMSYLVVGPLAIFTPP